MDDSVALDFDAILSNISDDMPSGTNPRSDISPTSLYYTLKDVRNTARVNERNAQIDDESLLSVAKEWLPIVEQVPEALATFGKDLELTAWLIEALCRLEGFRGLSEGFKLATALIETHWDSLYPEPDEEGLTTRIAPLVGLNGYDSPGSLVLPITAIPITESVSTEAYASWHFQQASEIARLPAEKQEQKIANGSCSMEALELAAKETNKQFFIDTNAEIQDCIDSFSKLSEAMDNAMEGEPQPTSYISKALKQCQDAIKFIAKDVLAAQSEEVATEEESQEDLEPSSTGETVVVSNAKAQDLPIVSREQAVKKIEEIATFFRKTEPHSPMSYALDQVIRWSDLSLPELLQELISDGDARNGFFKLSGIPLDE